MSKDGATQQSIKEISLRSPKIEYSVIIYPPYMTFFCETKMGVIYNDVSKLHIMKVNGDHGSQEIFSVNNQNIGPMLMVPYLAGMHNIFAQYSLSAAIRFFI